MRISTLSFFCLCARTRENLWVQICHFSFPFTVFHTSRGHMKKLNAFSKCTRSLLYLWEVSLRYSDTINLRLFLFNCVIFLDRRRLDSQKTMENLFSQQKLHLLCKDSTLNILKGMNLSMCSLMESKSVETARIYCSLLLF